MKLQELRQIIKEEIYNSNKIFILTSGEYSDYTIYGVFSSKEKASLYSKNYIKKHDFDPDFNIEEHLIDPNV